MKLRRIIAKITELRSKDRRWVYIGCAILSLLVAFFAAGMEGDFVVTVPYLLILAVCLIQFYRPTLLGWFFLTVPFISYTLAVATRFRQPPLHEFVIFLLLGGLPAVAFLCSWPKSLRSVEKNEPGMISA